jgi:hypothetical protein
MFTLFLVVAAGGLGAGAAPPLRGEERGLAYLVRAVPRWSPHNRCFSCHHNGDAARALFTAVRLGRAVPPGALADTLRWLARPDRWDHNGGDGPFNDRKLARLQFAAALVEARSAGLVKDRGAVEHAARLVAALQDRDGSWQVGADDVLGSPATHGTALATYFARRTLQQAGARLYKGAIARADTWLRKAPVETVMDAAVVLLALGQARDPAAMAQRRRCLEQIRKGQSPSTGAWGPYRKSPPEVFDTALVLLALSAQPQTAEVSAWVQRGRGFLRTEQNSDGSWPETTRPGGGQSQAQQLSTTAWAVLALLATRDTGVTSTPKTRP